MLRNRVLGMLLDHLVVWLLEQAQRVQCAWGRRVCVNGCEHTEQDSGLLTSAGLWQKVCSCFCCPDMAEVHYPSK